jgi:hypothetical protein
MSIFELISLHVALPNIVNEALHGAYHPCAIVLAHTPAHILMKFIESIVSVLLCILLLKWSWTSFIVTSLLLTWWTSVNDFFAHVFSMQPLVVGLLILAQYVLLGLMLSGYMAAAEFIIWPLRVLTYALPPRWGLQALAYTVLEPLEFEGATTCETSLLPLGPDTIVELCPDGYECPKLPFGPCWGTGGSRVLESLNMRHESITHENTYAASCAYFGVSSIVLKLTLTVHLIYRARGSASPKHKLSKGSPLSV